MSVTVLLAGRALALGVDTFLSAGTRGITHAFRVDALTLARLPAPPAVFDVGGDVRTCPIAEGLPGRALALPVDTRLPAGTRGNAGVALSVNASSSAELPATTAVVRIAENVGALSRTASLSYRTA